MRRIILIAIGLGIAQPVTAQTIVRTVDEITSKTAKVGDVVAFTVDGCETCSATGEVTLVEPRRNRARDGKLAIVVREVDGEPVSGTLEAKGKNVASDVLAAGAFGMAGLMVKGSHAKIETGTAIEVIPAQ